LSPGPQHPILPTTRQRNSALRTTGFSNRLSLYTDLLSVTGLLFGFAATALATYLAFSGQQINSFRARVGSEVLAQWMSTLLALGLTLIVLVFCKVLDRDGTSAAGVRWVAEGIVIFATTRMGRLLWIFKQIIEVATAPPSGRSRRRDPINVS
jgi:hypothetical protein